VQVKFDLGVGEIKKHILDAYKEATGIVRPAHQKHKEQANNGEDQNSGAVHKKPRVEGGEATQASA
jgi:hypothetical protein